MFGFCSLNSGSSILLSKHFKYNYYASSSLLFVLSYNFLLPAIFLTSYINLVKRLDY